jgi:GDP/UDP-N,N'-diacetylbacillosamine 2-epimerase (hydrolysing)
MTVDDVARHAISKLCSIHFPATKKSALRIASMGEEKWRIHVVGAPALDKIAFGMLPEKKEVYKYLRIGLSKKYILITQHPVSEQWEQSAAQIKETLRAAKHFNMPIVINYPNADAGGRRMIREIEKNRSNPLFVIRPSIPYEMFLAVEKYAAVWAGNSSGAMIESSLFHTPVVNIGIRQNGRERGNNVINTANSHVKIIEAIRKSLYNTRYRKSISRTLSPWGDGHASKQVVKILENLRITPQLINKSQTHG